MNMRRESKAVLYVDDEPQALKYFALNFGEKFSVATADSVDAAIAYLEQHAENVAVVVTDQRMPFKTGVELMEEIRRRYPNIVRVLTTAFSDLESAIRAVNDGGAFRYITKPWNEDDLTGTLLRAIDYHTALSDRDRLLKEKLSVLHRLIVMDRVRGLAVATTALEGRLRNAWSALTAYMEQSPVKQRVRVQMEEISRMNMTAVAKREGANMLHAVRMIIADTCDAATGAEAGVPLYALLADFVAAQSSDLQEEDVVLEPPVFPSKITIDTDRGMFRRLFAILIRRLADMHEEPLTIRLKLDDLTQDRVTFSVRGGCDDMTNGHLTSLFSAAIPLHKWPLGLDMDLLSAFLLAHHFGGALRVEQNSQEGPGFVVELPLHSPAAAGSTLDPESHAVFESLDEWERDILEDL